MTAAGGASPAADDRGELRILAEPDPIKRAEAAFEYARMIAAHIDGADSHQQTMMIATGEKKHLAGQQRVHVELAHASAMLGVAIELRELRRMLSGELAGELRAITAATGRVGDLLDERLRRPT